jgi:hypothetical protein
LRGQPINRDSASNINTRITDSQLCAGCIVINACGIERLKGMALKVECINRLCRSIRRQYLETNQTFITLEVSQSFTQVNGRF